MAMGEIHGGSSRFNRFAESYLDVDVVTGGFAAAPAIPPLGFAGAVKTLS